MKIEAEEILEARNESIVENISEKVESVQLNEQKFELPESVESISNDSYQKNKLAVASNLCDSPKDSLLCNESKPQIEPISPKDSFINNNDMLSPNLETGPTTFSNSEDSFETVPSFIAPPLSAINLPNLPFNISAPAYEETKVEIVPEDTIVTPRLNRKASFRESNEPPLPRIHSRRKSSLCDPRLPRTSLIETDWIAAIVNQAENYISTKQSEQQPIGAFVVPIMEVIFDDFFVIILGRRGF